MNLLQKLLNNKYFELCTIVMLLAIILRSVHFIYNPIFYGDECGLYENIKTLSYVDLIKGLSFTQAAPPVFMIGSKFVYEIFKNQPQYYIDLSLRLIPFICGILTIFAFWGLNKLIFDNKLQKLIAFFIFAINTQTIAYSAIFKQYSLELLVAIILLIISYKIIFQNKYKLYYGLIISLSMWLSYSCVFIVIPLMIYLLIKNKHLFKLISIPLLISASTLYCVSLKYVLSTSYQAMKSCWASLDFGYPDITHPTRIFIRFGEFFLFGASSPHKILTILCGILIIYFIITFLLSDNKYKMFLSAPLLAVILASIFKQYPIVARLILFLFPIISIMIASYDYKLKNALLTLTCIIALFSALFYLPNINVDNITTNRTHIEYSKGYLNLNEIYY